MNVLFPDCILSLQAFQDKHCVNIILHSDVCIYHLI